MLFAHQPDTLPTGLSRLLSIRSSTKLGDRSSYKELLRGLHPITLDDGNVDGIPIEIIENRGETNKIVFRRHLANGETSIVKVIRENPYHGNFLDQLIGGYLGQSLGGPRIKTFGQLEDRQGGSSGYYIEMEEVFPRTRKFSWKDNAFSDRMLIRNASGETIVSQFVAKLFEAADRGVSTDDPDILFTEDGRVRFVDTNAFRISSDPSKTRASIVSDVSRMLTHADSNAALRFEIIRSFLLQIKRSHRLDAAAKHQMIVSFGTRNFRRGILANTLFENGLLVERGLSEGSVAGALYRLYESF